MATVNRLPFWGLAGFLWPHQVKFRDRLKASKRILFESSVELEKRGVPLTEEEKKWAITLYVAIGVAVMILFLIIFWPIIAAIILILSKFFGL